MHSISGFYYVEAADLIYECKAKGNFRNKKITPLVGDVVEIETDGDKGRIISVNERRNFLLRPPIANIDRLFIVVSLNKPKPNQLVTDRLTAFAVHNGIEPVIVFSKCDLGDEKPYADIYSKTPFITVSTQRGTDRGLEEISGLISGKLCAFTGNSGVGKSTLLNSLMPELSLETNEISEKLGRGKHTTRSVSLYRYNNGFIADTPGFSSFELINDRDRIFKDELAECFPEFEPFVCDCTFRQSCSHISDKGCAVIEALKDGKIAPERHESYKAMYDEVKNLKSWDIQ